MQIIGSRSSVCNRGVTRYMRLNTLPSRRKNFITGEGNNRNANPGGKPAVVYKRKATISSPVRQ